MFSKIVFFFFFMEITVSMDEDGFIFNGFHGNNLSLYGSAAITPNGLLRLTDDTKQEIGRVFYPAPIRFKNTSNGKPNSFSATFVFAIAPDDPNLGGHGIAFVISPSKELAGALPSQYLGLYNSTNNGNSSNHVMAIELDTIRSTEFGDINDNHVGIDVNGLRSVQSTPAGYFRDEDGGFTSLTLISGEPVQAWVEFNGDNQLNVTLSPISVPKPNRPLLSSVVNLSAIVEDEMYVGFSSSTGSIVTYHYILGWSFKMSGDVQTLHLSRLPSLPRRPNTKNRGVFLAILLPLIAASFVFTAIMCIIYVMRRIKFAEVIEDWELQYGPHRFSYKDLYMATKGFSDTELLGTGGFGRVYKGVLPKSKIEIAVKKISHGSRQGMREFIAEIASIGRIRNRNLVRLLGYCRRKGELLLVYDFMPNGSLDKLLFDQTKSTLNWSQRFKIVKGVANGLIYLHEEWVQVVLHRDIKASNILLDHELNGALGDFGLARLYDHGSNPQTTHMVGTFGYISPELTRTAKPTTASDVFAFGVFLLEIACGKRPITRSPLSEDLILVDWVLECWKRGVILDVADPNMKGDYVVEEMELVQKLALLCSHPMAMSRPTMRQVVQFLDGDTSLPNLSPASYNTSFSPFRYEEGFDDLAMEFPSSIAESFLSAGR